MNRPFESSRRPLAAAALFVCFGIAGPCPAESPKAEPRAGAATAPVVEKDMDVRSGERALRMILGTDDLGPIRARAAEVGPAELKKERSRLDALRRSGRFGLDASASTWTSLGPTYRPIANGTPQNAGDNSGLMADVKIHPTDPRTIYAGTAGGGVWKSTDGGTNWTPLTDDLGQLPVGAIAISKTRPQRVYAGIGCGDTSSSYGAAPGIGVVISDDAGATWRVSRSGTGPGTAFFHLDVDPANPDVVLASSNTGVWRSTDGAETWTRVVAVPSQSLSRCTSSPNVVFVGTWGASPFVAGSVWRSADGGATWTEKATGLPGTSSTRARAEVAVAPTDPNRVYALFSKNDDSTLDVVVSDDGGSTWTAMNIGTSAPILGSQGTAFADMAVDPTNRDTVYAGGLDTWKTTDGGKTWKQLTRWQGVGSTLPYLHADQHAIAFGPDGALYFSTDGGLFRTTDGGQSFTSLNRNLVTLQYYYICQGQSDPNLILGGQQDNGTSMKVSGTEWRQVVGGDGFGCLVSPSEPGTLHASIYSQSIYRSTDGGARWSESVTGLLDAGYDNTNSYFITILRRHPTKPATIYTTSKTKLWVSTNNATQWSTNSTSTPVGLVNYRDFHVLSTDGSRILFAGNAGQVYETLDEGATVNRIGTVPVNTLSSVKYDRRNVRTIWVASSVTTSGLERVWRSTDGGATWSQLSNVGRSTGLPDMPVLVIDQDPWDPDVWWAGTYVGLYRSPDNGTTWTRHGFGLPNVIINDFGFYMPDKKIRVATFGRGVWEASAVPGPTAAAEILFPTVDTKVLAGSTVSLLGGATGADPAAFNFSWDFADGSAAGSGPQVRHAFNTPGTYTVVLTLTGTGGSSQTRRTITAIPNSGGFGPGGQTALSSGRVGVTVTFRDIYTGIVGPATPLKQADELAFFYFTDPLNPEVFVKVLDFGSTQPFLCFYGGLTNYEYTVTFTVLATGKSVSFVTPANSYKGGIDNTSLPWIAAAGAAAGPSVTALPGTPNAVDPQELLLQGGKVGVKVTWRNQFDGSSGTATPIPQQDAYGYFYFSAPTNAEVFVKVLDFGSSQPYLLFWAGLTNFEYTLTFRNTSTGKTWSYKKAAGTYDGGANTSDLPH